VVQRLKLGGNAEHYLETMSLLGGSKWMC
jgi:hypothetical protein